jgi:hypothetical protein
MDSDAIVITPLELPFTHSAVHKSMLNSYAILITPSTNFGGQHNLPNSAADMGTTIDSINLGAVLSQKHHEGSSMKPKPPTLYEQIEGSQPPEPDQLPKPTHDSLQTKTIAVAGEIECQYLQSSVLAASTEENEENVEEDVGGCKENHDQQVEVTKQNNVDDSVQPTSSVMGCHEQHEEVARPTSEPPPTGESTPAPVSPILMDPGTQEQGHELQEMLRLFKQTTTSPLSSYILQTPKHKMPSKEARVEDHKEQQYK